VGGIITQSVGGYGSPQVLGISCLMAFLATVVSLPIPFLDSFMAVIILMWILLFCGGFILPILTGILLNSVGFYERTVANSLANLSYNLLGYLPAPSIYGIVCNLTGGETSRYGIAVLMYSSVFSSATLFAALIFKLKRGSNRNKMETYGMRRSMGL
jgi:hypothetical protein